MGGAKAKKEIEWKDHTDEMPEIQDVVVKVGDRIVVTHTEVTVHEYPAQIAWTTLERLAEQQESGHWVCHACGCSGVGEQRRDAVKDLVWQLKFLHIEII